MIDFRKLARDTATTLSGGCKPDWKGQIALFRDYGANIIAGINDAVEWSDASPGVHEVVMGELKITQQAYGSNIEDVLKVVYYDMAFLGVAAKGDVVQELARQYMNGKITDMVMGKRDGIRGIVHEEDLYPGYATQLNTKLFAAGQFIEDTKTMDELTVKQKHTTFAKINSKRRYETLKANGHRGSGLLIPGTVGVTKMEDLYPEPEIEDLHENNENLEILSLNLDSFGTQFGNPGQDDFSQTSVEVDHRRLDVDVSKVVQREEEQFEHNMQISAKAERTNDKLKEDSLESMAFLKKESKQPVIEVRKRKRKVHTKTATSWMAELMPEHEQSTEEDVHSTTIEHSHENEKVIKEQAMNQYSEYNNGQRQFTQHNNGQQKQYNQYNNGSSQQLEPRIPNFDGNNVNNLNPTVPVGTINPSDELSYEWPTYAFRNGLVQCEAVAMDKMTGLPIIRRCKMTGDYLPVILTNDTASRFIFHSTDVNGAYRFNTYDEPIIAMVTPNNEYFEFHQFKGTDSELVTNSNKGQVGARALYENERIDTVGIANKIYYNGYGNSKPQQQGTGQDNTYQQQHSQGDFQQYNQQPAKPQGQGDFTEYNNGQNKTVGNPADKFMRAGRPTGREQTESAFDFTTDTGGRPTVNNTVIPVQRSSSTPLPCTTTDLILQLRKGIIIVANRTEDCLYMPKQVNLIEGNISYNTDVMTAVNAWIGDVYQQVLVTTESLDEYAEAVTDGQENMLLELSSGEGTIDELKTEEIDMGLKEDMMVKVSTIPLVGDSDMVGLTIFSNDGVEDTVYPAQISRVLPGELDKGLLEELENLEETPDREIKKLLCIIKFLKGTGETYSAGLLSKALTTHSNIITQSRLGLDEKTSFNVDDLVLDYDDIITHLTTLSGKIDVDLLSLYHKFISAEILELYNIDSELSTLTTTSEDNEEIVTEVNCISVTTNSLAMGAKTIDGTITDGEITLTQHTMLFNMVSSAFKRADAKGLFYTTMRVYTDDGSQLTVLRTINGELDRLFCFKSL